MGCSDSKDTGVSAENVAAQLAKRTQEAGGAAVDQVHAASMMITGKTKTKAHHLKNVFAAPLGDVSPNYKAPKFEKSKQEELFLIKAMSKNFVFDGLPSSATKTLVDAFEHHQVKARDTIIKQGEEGDYFYVLEKGKVIIKVNDGTVGTATDGQSFGELSLLYSAPRAASIIAETDCQLFRLDQKTFRYILQSQTQQADSKKKELVQNIPFLQGLDENDLNKLIEALVPRPFQEKEVLVKKGTQGDVFYILQEGHVKVTNIEIGHAKYQDQELGPGDYFGERALVTSEPRTADCIATTEGIALTVDKETFKVVMGDLSRLVLKAGDKRKLAAIKVFSDMLPSDRAALAQSITDKTYEKGTVIAKEGEKIEAALFLVRDGGKIQISSKDGKQNNVIESGGYFGQELLELDRQRGNTDLAPSRVSQYTITAMEETTMGVLTLEECRKLFDTTTMGAAKKAAGPKLDIKYKALKKHKILGAGTFGQVWLVSVKDSTGGGRTPYALKIQSKYDLIQQDMSKGVVQERNIMSQLDHPFIIKLVNTYQDKQRIYMLVSLVQGGELFSVLHSGRKDGVPEAHAKFYAAGILAGLSYMHRRNIIYRDLKPENVLVNTNGYPVIIDMGFAKVVPKKTYTFCGTPLYVAPEIILNRGHDKGADHWSLGVLIYEMIDGETPFYKEGMDQMSLFQAIVKGKFLPSKKPMSQSGKDLVNKMLVATPSRRLGSLAGGINDLFRQAWFRDMNFETLQSMELKAPWVPKVKDPLDCSAFEDWSHLDDKDKVKDPPISKGDDALFKDF